LISAETVAITFDSWMCSLDVLNYDHVVIGNNRIMLRENWNHVTTEKQNGVKYKNYYCSDSEAGLKFWQFIQFGIFLMYSSNSC
jgi:hypothetical protein